VTGRYDNATPASYTGPDGVSVNWLVPLILEAGPSSPPPRTTTVGSEEVNRLDLVAARVLGQADQAWRLAQANDGMDPFDLCRKAGTVLRLPASEL
jgi:hypothetical protein